MLFKRYSLNGYLSHIEFFVSVASLFMDDEAEEVDDEPEIEEDDESELLKIL